MATTKTLNVRHKFPYKSETEWASTSTPPLKGEVCYSTDNGLYKIGDGTTSWSNLNYAVQEYLDKIFIPYSFSKTLTLSANTWKSTGITYSSFESGSYLVQMIYNSIIYSGVMSWNSGGSASEIYLQGSGDDYNFSLKTDNGILYIISEVALSSASFKFNFKKVI